MRSTYSTYRSSGSPVTTKGAKEVGEYVFASVLVCACCGIVDYILKQLPGNNKKEELHIYLNNNTGSYDEVFLRPLGEMPQEDKE